MKDSDVRIGMKVVPHDKTASWGCRKLSDSSVWIVAKNRNQPYLYVTEFDKEVQSWMLRDSSAFSDGDYFAASDFEPYKEPTP